MGWLATSVKLSCRQSNLMPNIFVSVFCGSAILHSQWLPGLLCSWSHQRRIGVIFHRTEAYLFSWQGPGDVYDIGYGDEDFPSGVGQAVHFLNPMVPCMCEKRCCPFCWQVRLLGELMPKLNRVRLKYRTQAKHLGSTIAECVVYIYIQIW